MQQIIDPKSELEDPVLPSMPDNDTAAIRIRRSETVCQKSIDSGLLALIPAFASAVLTSCENSMNVIAQNGEYGVFAVFSRIVPEVVDRIFCFPLST